jgi:plasmid stabilization system protein ParE
VAISSFGQTTLLKNSVEPSAYLEGNFTDREIRRLAGKIEFTLKLISQNPFTFPVSERSVRVRRAVVTKLNIVYYRVSKNQIEILSFFSSRQNPDQLNF